MSFKTLRFILAHPLNRGRPWRTLVRYVRWQIGSRIAIGPVLVDFVDDVKLAVRPGMTGATGNVYCGLHELDEMAFCLHLLRPGDLFVDVGANIGSYALLAAATGADVIAFEPAERFSDLLLNASLNRLNIDCRKVAVGAAPGVLRFTAGLDSVNHAAIDGEPFVETPVTTLDASLERAPTLIKVDVEGYEQAVIEGGQRVVPQAMALIVELNRQGERYGFSEPALRRQLLGWGFREFGYDALARAERAPKRRDNVIYVKGDVAKRLREAPRRRVNGLLI